MLKHLINTCKFRFSQTYNNLQFATSASGYLGTSHHFRCFTRWLIISLSSRALLPGASRWVAGTAPPAFRSPPGLACPFTSCSDTSLLGPCLYFSKPCPVIFSFVRPRANQCYWFISLGPHKLGAILRGRTGGSRAVFLHPLVLI